MSILTELKTLPYYHTLEDSARIIYQDYPNLSLNKIILILFILAGLYDVNHERLKQEFQYRISCSEHELEQEIYQMFIFEERRN